MVNDDGREASERVKGLLSGLALSMDLASVEGDGSASGDRGGVDLARSSSRLSLPIPMFS